LKKIIRLHLTRQVQAFKHAEALKTPTPLKEELPPEIQVDSEQLESEDLGLIDLVEIFEERFKELGEIAERIGKSTEELGERFKTRTKELGEVVVAGGQVDRKLAKRLMEKAAADMDQYVERIEAEIPLFSLNLDEGMNAIINTTKIMVEFGISESDRTKAPATIEALVTLREILASTENSISQFQMSITSIPRMTSVLNKSKRRVTAVLDRLIEQLRTGQRLTTEAEQAISNIIQE
jgi:hypothetical protein